MKRDLDAALFAIENGIADSINRKMDDGTDGMEVDTDTRYQRSHLAAGLACPEETSKQPRLTNHEMSFF